MSDQSLPKPVPPKNSQGKTIGNKPQMPPSARFIKSAASLGKPPINNQLANKPPVGKSPIGKPPVGKPILNNPQTNNMPIKNAPINNPQVGSFSKNKPDTKSSLSESPLISSKNGENKKPVFADVKNSPFKYLPYLIGGLVLIGIVGLVLLIMAFLLYKL